MEVAGTGTGMLFDGVWVGIQGLFQGLSRACPGLISGIAGSRMSEYLSVVFGLQVGKGNEDRSFRSCMKNWEGSCRSKRHDSPAQSVLSQSPGSTCRSTPDRPGQLDNSGRTPHKQH